MPATIQGWGKDQRHRQAGVAGIGGRGSPADGIVPVARHIDRFAAPADPYRHGGGVFAAELG